MSSSSWVVVGLDNGGTCNNATVLDSSRQFLVATLLESPSSRGRWAGGGRRRSRPSTRSGISHTGVSRAWGPRRRARQSGAGERSRCHLLEGLDQFFPSRLAGSFDFRGALELRLGIPVIYNNDGNSPCVRSSRVLRTRGCAAVLGLCDRRHRPRRWRDRGRAGRPRCCRHGRRARPRLHPDARTSRRGPAGSGVQLRVLRRRRERRLLDRDREEPAALLADAFPDHELAKLPSIVKAAKTGPRVRRRTGPDGARHLRPAGDGAGPAVSDASNFVDPDAYFVGGGVVEASADLRQWFLDRVREHSLLRTEQLEVAAFALIPDLDMAGARGAALAAFDELGSL